MAMVHAHKDRPETGVATAAPEVSTETKTETLEDIRKEGDVLREEALKALGMERSSSRADAAPATDASPSTEADKTNVPATETKATAETTTEVKGATLSAEEAKQVAAKIYERIEGMGCDVPSIVKILKDLPTQADRDLVAAEFKAAQKTSLTGMLSGAQFSVDKTELHAVEKALEGNLAAAKAYLIHDAMKGGYTGIGADGKNIKSLLNGASKEEIAEIKAEYRELTGGTELTADIRDEFEGKEYIEIMNLLQERSFDPFESAAKIHDAMKGGAWYTLGTSVGTDIDTIREELTGRTPDELRMLEEAYNIEYGNLRTDLKGELSDIWFGQESEILGMLDADRDRVSEIKQRLKIDQPEPKAEEAPKAEAPTATETKPATPPASADPGTDTKVERKDLYAAYSDVLKDSSKEQVIKLARTWLKLSDDDKIKLVTNLVEDAEKMSPKTDEERAGMFKFLSVVASLDANAEIIKNLKFDVEGAASMIETTLTPDLKKDYPKTMTQEEYIKAVGELEADWKARLHAGFDPVPQSIVGIPVEELLKVQIKSPAAELIASNKETDYKLDV